MCQDQVYVANTEVLKEWIYTTQTIWDGPIEKYKDFGLILQVKI